MAPCAVRFRRRAADAATCSRWLKLPLTRHSRIGEVRLIFGHSKAAACTGSDFSLAGLNGYRELGT